MSEVILKYSFNIFMIIIFPILGLFAIIGVTFGPIDNAIKFPIIVVIILLLFLVYSLSEFTKKSLIKEILIIDKIKKTIKKLEKEIELIPDDELLEDIKNIKKESIKNFRSKIKEIVENYIKRKFDKVYVIIPEESEKYITNDVKDAYKIIAQKKFNSNNIKLLTAEQFDSLIENEIDQIFDNYALLNKKLIKVLTNTKFNERLYNIQKYKRLLDIKPISEKEN